MGVFDTADAGRENDEDASGLNEKRERTRGKTKRKAAKSKRGDTRKAARRKGTVRKSAGKMRSKRR